MKQIAVIDYNAGNIRSVLFALERLGIDPILSRDPEVLNAADKIIFPGVGEAGTTMAYLKESGLSELIRSYRKPFLGICLGLQLMCRYSEEGGTDCLNIFDISVKKFPNDMGLKVPHMGWNTVQGNDHPLFKDLDKDPYFYFVHSYYAEIDDITIGKTQYGQTFTSVLAHDNYMATQFHPEKSGLQGEQLLKNFIKI